MSPFKGSTNTYCMYRKMYVALMKNRNAWPIVIFTLNLKCM